MGGPGVDVSEEQVVALGTAVQRRLLTEPLPAAWAKARAVFLPKSRSSDIEAQRPVAEGVCRLSIQV